MADLFILNAPEDQVHAQCLVVWLEARGYTVSWNVAQEIGADYAIQIAPELAAAQIVLVLWSPHSVGSKEVIGWALTALRYGKLLQIKVNADEELNLPVSFTNHVVFDLSQTEAITTFIAEKLTTTIELREPVMPPDDEPITEVKGPPPGHGADATVDGRPTRRSVRLFEARKAAEASTAVKPPTRPNYPRVGSPLAQTRTRQTARPQPRTQYSARHNPSYLLNTPTTIVPPLFITSNLTM